jgi:vacuolar-type H+-ATPase subunit E/Vma4
VIKDNEKAEMFLDAINLDAKKRCEKLKQDVDNYIDSELQKARALAHEEVKSFKKSELDRLNEQNNADLSELEAQERKTLIDKRTEIANEVFAKAEEKISAFAGSDKYIDFLKASIESLKSELGDNITVILKPDDKKYESDIAPLCKEVKYDSAIRLGGCRAENLDAKLIADDTLEVRLNEAKQNFYKNSGLSITL